MKDESGSEPIKQNPPSEDINGHAWGNPLNKNGGIGK